ncbi:Apolipophorin [Portunus trituberculatus]|uniref:Apolipophorin n=1 Tax=Portunus trituberculatus TaxID=210409 RepID=A0A5B7D626_PORTR|nr:Apolipophorin [Portunus trituberculatus]
MKLLAAFLLLLVTRVNDLVVEDTGDDAKWFSEAVQEHDLYFRYQHGAVTDLYPHEEEEAVATNFKRGILSSLQMTVSPTSDMDIIVSEVDVSGECDVKYSMEMDPNPLITKTKMGCHANTYIPYLPHSYYTNTKANSHLPFMKNSHVCHIHGKEGTGPRGDIDVAGGGGMWEKVICSEEVQVHHHLTPNSNRSSLATVSMSSTLMLEEGPKPMDGNFSNGDVLRKTVSLVADLKAAVNFAEMKKLSNQNVKEQLDSVLESLSTSEDSEPDDLRPRLFSTLVHLLSHLNVEELEDVWSSSSSENTHRKILVDGLLVCDANPCHSLVAQLAQDQGMLSQGQLNMWLAGIHMHTSAHLEFVTKLLVFSTISFKSALLPLRSFLEYVDQQVGVSCGHGKTRQQQEHIKLVMRALGNAGVFPSKDFPERCYLNRTLSPELRIAALQSYRRSGCSGVEAPWKLLEDGREKSEVRIAAYLALVPCATYTSGFFTRIHKLLQQEKVQQVYSFIWTHVKNLVDKPGPSKHDQELSKLARQHTLPNKFNNDAFRTSGNFRYTHFSESMNLGGSVDANVVFSHESYVPHQISANLTLDLLDNSFNFLDIGGEFSGIENLIESYFGKDAYFSNKDVLKILHNLRPKRNIVHEDKIQEFQKKFDTKKKNQLEWEKNEEEAKPSFYVRMFGNEILYVENMLQHSPAQLLYQLIQELSSPKTFKILDQEYMTPTLLGFPLRLKVNATASVSLQHELTFRSTKNLGLQLEGSLTPSVVAAMDEMLLVDAFVSSSGLRRSSTQVAKTTIGGKFLVQENEVVEIQLSVPNSEVMKMSSSARVALLNSDGKWVEPKSKTVPVESCIDTVSEMVGLEVCTSLSHGQYEVDGELVTAEPSEMNFLIKKTDSFNYYKLYITQQESIIEALFDTPGSSIDRKIHFLFNVNPDREGGYIVVRGAGYGIKGQYKDSDGYSGLQLEYLQESKVSGELEISMKKQVESLRQEYIPKFLVSVGPDKFTLEGKWKHMIDEDTKNLEASWEIEGAWHKTEPNMVTQAFGRVSGTFMTGQDNFKLDLNTEYGSESSDSHSITLTLNNNHTLHGDMSIFAGYASLQISQIPAGITMEYESRPDLFELNTNTSLQDTQVSSQVVVKNVMSTAVQDTQLTLSLASKQLDIDYKASGIYKVSDNGFQAEAELNFDSSFKSKFLIMYLFEDEPLHVLAGLHLTLNDFIFQIGHSIDMSQPDHLLITYSACKVQDLG